MTTENAKQSEPQSAASSTSSASSIRRFSLFRLIYSIRDEQLRHLSQSARLEESVSPRAARLTALAISLSAVAFIGWSSVAEVNEVARTSGEVVPRGFEQVVQHLDGGIVSEIMAREGAVVRRGETLLRFDGSSAEADLRRAERKQWALETQAERLRAFVEDRKPDFSNFAILDQRFIDEQRAIFSTMIRARRQQANVVRDQIKQRRRDLAILTSRLETASANLVDLRELYEMYKSLHAKGHSSLVKLTEVKQQLTSLSGEERALGEQIEQARNAIDEFNTRLRSLSAAQRDDAYRELHSVEAELLQNQQTIEKLKARVARLEVPAPVDGIVKGLAVNTIGGIVQSGQAMMSIVPLDQKLVVETCIAPQYIGNIKVGQPVQIKISAYDSARYGALDGKLEFISATTFSDNGSDRYYRGRIVFNTENFDENYKDKAILPGMTVMAEIITGEKTVLEYLLRPVQRAMGTAFSER